jgi:large subunit ribosomal protein L28
LNTSCVITGKKTITGNTVSHSNRKTKRVFKPNLLKKRFYIPDEDRWVVLKVSAKGLKVIDKIGITAALKRSEALGLLH